MTALEISKEIYYNQEITALEGAELINQYAEAYHKTKVEESSIKLLEDVRVANKHCNAEYTSAYYQSHREFKEELLKPKTTLSQAIQKAKPNLDRIKDVDAFIDEVKGVK